MEYTIQAAARISGLSAHTLRAWERRHNAVTPSRDDAGRRVYAQDQVDRLIQLSRLCQLGYSIGQLADKAVDELGTMLENLGEDLVQKRGMIGLSLSDIDTIKGNLILALRFFKLDVLNHEFEKLAQTATAFDIGKNLFLEFIREVNHLQAINEITDTQRYAISSLLTSRLYPIIAREQAKIESDSPLYLIVQPVGESRSIGNFGSDLICTNHKIKTLNLGPMGNIESLSQIISSVNPVGVIFDFCHQIKDHNRAEVVSGLGKIIQSGERREYHFLKPNFEIQNTSGVSLFNHDTLSSLDASLADWEQRQ
jgi:DNA-binding transcriptional MerR regulator